MLFPILDLLDLPDGAKRNEEIMELLNTKLPDPNKTFINHMLEFLKKVSMLAETNMMTSANLGTCSTLD